MSPASPPRRPSQPPERRPGAGPRLGVWIFGARGGLATTLIAGTRALARRLVEPHGLITATPAFAGVGLPRLDDLVFGGHEIRDGSLAQSAREIHDSTGTIPFPLLRQLAGDLAKADREIRAGTLVNAGRSIETLAGPAARGHRPGSLRAEVDRLRVDVRSFMKRQRLSSCVCVNLTSTEPRLRLGAAHRSLAALDRALDRDRSTAVRPSTLYAYVAADLGLPFIHFTPANGALVPAIVELFARNGAPFMGSDGKTGETLVKSSLAPMFRYRNLRVLTWQGYNILGDRDGVILADQENKSSKVETKDALLAKILGYPLHTHVGIDYVPSLSDLKTAWDFIHFQGFLGFKMSMQFVWQGCDAILAAPIVLDMVRLAELARRRGESGPMPQLASFFKQPFGVDQHDLHAQWQAMTAYLQRLRAGRDAADGGRQDA